MLIFIGHNQWRTLLMIRSSLCCSCVQLHVDSGEALGGSSVSISRGVNLVLIHLRIFLLWTSFLILWTPCSNGSFERVIRILITVAWDPIYVPTRPWVVHKFKIIIMLTVLPVNGDLQHLTSLSSRTVVHVYRNVVIPESHYIFHQLAT